MIDGLATRELQWLQIVRIFLDSFSCLRLEARNILQEFNFLGQLLLLQFLKTVLKVCLAHNSEVHIVLHRFDRSVSWCLREQGILAEAILFVFLVNFLVIVPVDPFVSRTIDGKLVRLHVLEELRVGTTTFTHKRCSYFRTMYRLIRANRLIDVPVSTDPIHDFNRDAFRVEKGRLRIVLSLHSEW